MFDKDEAEPGKAETDKESSIVPAWMTLGTAEEMPMEALGCNSAH